MLEKSTQILKQVLSLPAEERAEMAEQILSSLETSPHKKIDALWAQEAESRLDAFDRGEIPTISAEEVFNRINQKKNS